MSLKFPLYLMVCIGCCIVGTVPSLVSAAPKQKPPTLVRKTLKAGLTRAQAIQFALRNNPKWKATQARLQTALANLRGRKVFPSNPVLEGKGKGKAKPKGNAFEVNPYQLDMEMSWKLPVGGWWTRNITLAKQILRRVKAELKAIRWELTLKVHKHYNKVLLAQQKVALYKTVVETFENILKATQQRLREGALTRFNLLNAQVSLLTNKTALMQYEAKVRVETQKLQEVLGWKQKGFPRLLSPLPSPQPLVGKWNPVVSLSTHPWLRVLQEKVKEARLKVSAAQGKAFPDIKLKLVYTFEEGGIHTFGGGFAIPLPVLARNQRKIWTSQAKSREVRLKQAALQYRLQQWNRQRTTEYVAQQKIWVVLQKRLLPLTKISVKLRKVGLKAGAIPILRVLSAQKSLQKALLGRIKAQEKALSSYLKLCKSRGQLPLWN